MKVKGKTTVWNLGYGFWACQGAKTYTLNPNSWRPWGRVVHAMAIRGEPWYHRNLYFSCITGEQIQYEAVQPLRKP